ncbi:GGDEF domain-containing protein [Candidatus Fermentibacteria bacterium]|nr:GGDEF domain-containing protein [Candidatus Fermentibacteria bacterium]
MRIHKPLELCRVDRALILAALPMLFYAVGTAVVARDLQSHLPSGPSRLVFSSAVDWALGVVAGYAVLIALGVVLRHRSPSSGVFVYMTLVYFAINNAILATFIGPLSSPPWLSILGLAVLGLLLLGSREVFTSISIYLVALGLIHALGTTGRLPYRYIFEEGAAPSWWMWRMAVVTIANTVIIVLVTAYVVAAWQRRESSFRDLSNQDDLTGVGNRRFLSHALRTEFSRARRYGREMTYAIVDLDHFKRVNDRHGHPIGDFVLRATAKALTASTRESDTVARWGGDEFVLLLPETGVSGAQELAERCRAAIRATVAAETGIGITSSVGIASMRHEGLHSPDDLARIADTALYAAKQAGRNRVVIAAEPAKDGVVTFPRIVSQNPRPNAM